MRLPIASAQQTRAYTGVLLRRHRGRLTAIVTLHSVAALAGLVGPWLLGRLVDAITTGTATANTASQLALTLAIAVIIQAIVVRYAQYSSLIFGERIFAQLREDFLDTVVSLPLSTVERAGTGDLVARTTNDIDHVAVSARWGVPRIIVTATTTIVTVIVAIITGSWVALSLLTILPLTLLVTRRYLKYAPDGYQRVLARYAVLNGTINETVDGAHTVDALDLGQERRNRIDSILLEMMTHERYVLDLRSWWLPSMWISLVLPVVTSVAWGAVLISWDVVSVGQVTAVALYAFQLTGPVDELLRWVDEIQVGAASLSRLIGVSNVEPDRYASGDDPDGHHVIAEDLRYAYRAGHDVLHGIDLALTPGERLAVVGPSGAGKSTLGRMLAGIHPPSAGHVSVGGVRLVDLPLPDLRRRVALVTQEHHVFVGTLAENLRLAKPDATDEELWQALDAVAAHQWAAELPDGLQTAVASGGLELSPAQAQQVALARLVLLDPHTLILDEATSLLDPRAARDLERSLSAVLAGRTVVAIAHRLHTAHDADRVAVVDGGKITEIGSHHELVAADGNYAALWRSWQT